MSNGQKNYLPDTPQQAQLRQLARDRLIPGSHLRNFAYSLSLNTRLPRPQVSLILVCRKRDLALRRLAIFSALRKIFTGIRLVVV